MAFFRLVPNLVIMAPKDFKELGDMLEFAVELGKPVVIRYPRGGEDSIKFQKYEKISLGQAEVIQQGKDISIIAIGKMVSRAMRVAEKLKEKNIETEVINARFLKELDKETIKKSIVKTKYVITIEDGTIINGLATAVKELIVDEKIEDICMQTYAYPDKFIKHGTVQELEEIYEMDEKSIISKIDFEHLKNRVEEKIDE